jgi:HK97 family phage prohead protease
VRLEGYFSRFNRWAEIDSAREGRFREMVAPGAFTKTLTENRNRIKLLLSHGHHPTVGDAPIGKLTELREDREGGFYRADLFTGIPELVLDGMRAGEWQASFRFRAVREQFTARPGRSADNPEGLATRVIKEARLVEVSPTPWPAYEGTSAAIRAAGDKIELRTHGAREELLPQGLGSGSTPGTIRRLRRDGSAHARELLRALERGETVSLTWAGGTEVRGRILGEAGRERSWRLPRRGEASWRLDTRQTEPSWRL